MVARTDVILAFFDAWAIMIVIGIFWVLHRGQFWYNTHLLQRLYFIVGYCAVLGGCTTIIICPDRGSDSQQDCHIKGAQIMLMSIVIVFCGAMEVEYHRMRRQWPELKLHWFQRIMVFYPLWAGFSPKLRKAIFSTGEWAKYMYLW